MRPAILLCFALVLVPHPVAGQTTKPASSDASALLDQGKKAYQQALFGQAVDRLTRARGLTDDAARLAQINLYLGLSHHGMNQPGAARSWFVEALTHDPGVSLDPAQFKPALVSLLEEARGSLRGRLSVAVDGEGGRLVVDGEPVAGTSYNASVSIGTHQVQLFDHQGRKQVQREVMVRAGRLVELRLMLPGSRQQSVLSRAAEQPAARPRRWTWIAAGGAAASLGLAVGFGVAARSTYDQGQTLIDQGLASDQVARYRELDRELDQRRLGANISWALAGGLAATAVILFFLE
jgi:hypothetical protein